MCEWNRQAGQHLFCRDLASHLRHLSCIALCCKGFSFNWARCCCPEILLHRSGQFDLIFAVRFNLSLVRDFRKPQRSLPASNHPIQHWQFRNARVAKLQRQRVPEQRASPSADFARLHFMAGYICLVRAGTGRTNGLCLCRAYGGEFEASGQLFCRQKSSGLVPGTVGQNVDKSRTKSRNRNKIFF